MRATSPYGLIPPPEQCSGSPAHAVPQNASAGPVKDERKRITVLYSGQVQGVGFRYTTCQVASGFDVCGTVRNLADGRVELVAEGMTSELEAFRAAIRDAGIGPMIRDEAVQWTAPRGDLRGFQILR